MVASPKLLYNIHKYQINLGGQEYYLVMRYGCIVTDP
jgi:hypothetical protein